MHVQRLVMHDQSCIFIWGDGAERCSGYGFFVEAQLTRGDLLAEPIIALLCKFNVAGAEVMS